MLGGESVYTKLIIKRLKSPFESVRGRENLIWRLLHPNECFNRFEIELLTAIPLLPLLSLSLPLLPSMPTEVAYVA